MAEQPLPEPKSAPRRSEQDQAIANLITQAQQKIEIARDDPEIASILAQRGYPAPKLDEGLGLQQAAQAAFTARQTAMAAQKQATATLVGAEAAARGMCIDYRETARAVFPLAADRTALGLSGKLPQDTQKFITAARASYTTALQEPYVTTLTTYGFPAATIQSALTALDTMAKADEAQDAAIGAATQATDDRDAAIKKLNAWLKQFIKIAGVALKQRPDLRKKLSL